MRRVHAIKALVLGASIGAPRSVPALRPTAASSVARDAHQESRIESGLQNGSITTREGALLQKDEARVNRLQAKDLKDGRLSPVERAKLNVAQKKAGRDITTVETNGINGNPLSASSQRMQAGTQRNADQQKRIEQGVQDKSLTNREVASLERGQSHVDRKEVAASRDGHVGAREQAGVQRSENHQSKRIRRDKTNTVNRG